MQTTYRELSTLIYSIESKPHNPQAPRFYVADVEQHPLDKGSKQSGVVGLRVPYVLTDKTKDPVVELIMRLAYLNEIRVEEVFLREGADETMSRYIYFSCRFVDGDKDGSDENNQASDGESEGK